MNITTQSSIHAYHKIRQAMIYKTPANAMGVILDNIRTLNIKECLLLIEQFPSSSRAHLEDSKQMVYALRHRILIKMQQKVAKGLPHHEAYQQLSQLKLYMEPDNYLHKPLFGGIARNIHLKLGLANTAHQSPLNIYQTLLEQYVTPPRAVTVAYRTN